MTGSFILNMNYKINQGFENMKSENEIQKELIKTCREHPRVAWISRANSGRIRTKGGVMQLHPKGTSDLVGFSTKGLFFGIEIKTPEAYHSKNHSMNKDQIEFAGLVNMNGGVCGTACNEKTLLDVLERL